MASAPADPFAPARLGGLEVRNRVLKAATFEGIDLTFEDRFTRFSSLASERG